MQARRQHESIEELKPELGLQLRLYVTIYWGTRMLTCTVLCAFFGLHEDPNGQREDAVNGYQERAGEFVWLKD